MEQTTECVTTAECKLEDKIITRLIELGFKVYYYATCYLPRPLPRTLDEFLRLKGILTKYYGLEDKPAVWFTIASQMTVGQPTSIRKAYIYYANAAKRLPTNRLVSEAKTYFNKLNEEEIEKLTGKIIIASQSTELEPEPPRAA